jgi:hypothetical protein
MEYKCNKVTIYFHVSHGYGFKAYLENKVVIKDRISTQQWVHNMLGRHGARQHDHGIQHARTIKWS